MNGGINKMSVKSCEKIEKSQVVLTIEVGAPEFEAAIEKAYQKMRKKNQRAGLPPWQGPPEDHRGDVRRRGVFRRGNQYRVSRGL